MKKSSIICGAFLAIFSFSSCIENTPSAGVEAIRNGYATKLNAKAEAIKISAESQAAIDAAKAAKIAAEAAVKQAEADLDQTDVKAAEIVNQKAELQLEVDKARIALEVLQQENAKEAEIKSAEMNLANLRYQADSLYLSFQKDSLVKVQALELAQKEYQEAKLENETAIADAVRKAENASWTLSNTLTDQQSAEAAALKAKVGEYPVALVNLETAKTNLANAQYNIKTYEAYTNGAYKKAEGFFDRAELIEDAQESLTKTQEAKADLETYLAYLKAVPENADDYTKELIRLEKEMDELSDKIGELTLERNQASLTFNDNNDKEAMALLDTDYEALKALEEVYDKTDSVYTSAKKELADFLNLTDVDYDYNIWVEVDGEWQMTSAEVWVKERGTAETYYDAVGESIEKISYQIDSKKINDEYFSLYQKLQTSGSLTTGEWDRVNDIRVLSNEHLRSFSYWFPNSNPQMPAYDPTDPTANKATLINGSLGLTQQIALISTTTDQGDLVKKDQLTQEKAEKEKALADLKATYNTYYAEWKKLDNAYNAAKAANDPAEEAYDDAYTAFQELLDEVFNDYYRGVIIANGEYYYFNDPVTSYSTFTVSDYEQFKEIESYGIEVYHWESNSGGYYKDVTYMRFESLPKMYKSSAFEFAKQDELDEAIAAFNLDKQYYSRLVAFLNGSYEANQNYDYEDDTYGKTYFDGTPRELVNATTIKYYKEDADGNPIVDVKPYNSIQLNNEIEKVEAQLADSENPINTNIEAAQKELDKINEIAVDAKEVDLFNAMLAIEKIKEANFEKLVAYYQTTYDKLVVDIESLTEAVNALAATQN